MRTALLIFAGVLGVFLVAFLAVPKFQKTVLKTLGLYKSPRPITVEEIYEYTKGGSGSKNDTTDNPDDKYYLN